MSESRRELLRAVLDCLLPAHEELPGAGELGLASGVERELEAGERWSGARELLAQLPENFLAIDPLARDRALHALEQTEPSAFRQLIELAYGAYYTDARVLRWVETRTGYFARPPQPIGYELAPFDESLLDAARRRQPFYRQA